METIGQNSGTHSAMKDMWEMRMKATERERRDETEGYRAYEDDICGQRWALISLGSSLFERMDLISPGEYSVFLRRSHEESFSFEGDYDTMRHC